MTQGPVPVTLNAKVERRCSWQQRQVAEKRTETGGWQSCQGEAWPRRKMEMKFIPLGRSRSAWKPFCKVWRLSQLPEPAASVTAGAESWDRKQPKPKLDKEATASR